MKNAISIWEAETFFAPQDYIIIGGGFLGLWSAIEIANKKPAAKITILEKGIIPTGASTRNAGFACFGSPTELISDADKMGDTAMWEVVKMRYEGIKKIRSFFTDEMIDFDSSGGYECFVEPKNHLKNLEEKLDWLNSGLHSITGQSNGFKWCNEKIVQFGLSGFQSMISNDLEGGLHSGKLLQKLTSKAQQLGIQIITGVEAKSWERIGGDLNIICNIATFKAQQLLICVNAFLPQLFPNANIEPARGQVIATAPIKDLKLNGTFHFQEGFYYFRNLNNRILIGGARNTDFLTERSDKLELNDDILETLTKFISNHLLSNQSFEVDYAWSGIMGFNTQKIPTIKNIEPGVFYASACNGMGVALAPMVAEDISKAMV